MQSPERHLKNLRQGLLLGGYSVALLLACVPSLPTDCSLECGLAAGIGSGDAIAASSPGIALEQSGNSTALIEGGAGDAYSLVLNTEPTADVSIQITPDAQITANGMTIPIQLDFTSGACPGTGNWCTPQSVTVTAIDDTFAEGAHTAQLTHTVTTDDAQYAAISLAPVNAAITDDDVPAVILSEGGGSTNASETGATDSYTLALSTQPTANVIVTITPDAQTTANASALPINFTFTAGACPAVGDWCTAQTVNVAAVDDDIAEGTHTGTLTHSTSSADPNYNGLAVAALAASITDDEVAGVSIAESAGSTAGSESGAADSYTLVLTSQPLADVTISVSPNAQLQANASSTATNLVFTAGLCPGPGNWCTAQTVNVTAVDDGTVEGTHTGVLSHAATSTDPAYNGIGVAALNASIADNDRYTFRTAATHNGDFDNDVTLGGNSDGSGISEADQFCMNDANRPSADTYKALISKVPLGGGAHRRGSQTANAGDGQIDWVLAPNISYYRQDGTTLLFTSDGVGLLNFSSGSFTNSWAATPGDVWTGTAMDWRAAPPFQSCTGWSSAGGNAATGDATVTDATAIANSSQSCALALHLICVQQ